VQKEGIMNVEEENQKGERKGTCIPELNGQRFAVVSGCLQNKRGKLERSGEKEARGRVSRVVGHAVRSV